MAVKVEKHRSQSSSDESIIQECQNKLKCGDCKIQWLTAHGFNQITPPNTVMVAVDLRGKSKGAIRIFETSSGEYVDGVGTELAGNLILIPWQSDWNYSTAGSLPVGYVVKAMNS